MSTTVVSKSPALITLTTDFGTADWFVGVMKGVIAKIAPHTRLIDLTHEVSPGNIQAGAFSLMSAYRFFPEGTIHLAVVDPGVGSQRKALVVQTTDYFFIAPDNGLLSWALRNEEIKATRVLENDYYFLQPVSNSFHGRDIFAPVAAHLSCGVALSEFGPSQDNFVRLEWPVPRATPRGVQGEIIYCDRFGNVITNLETASLQPLARYGIQVVVKGKRLCSLAQYYGAVPTGKPVAIFGSSGFLEIAVNGGNAAKRLGLRVGDRIELTGSP
jgi:S-adenosyl-L-methionine hydrolase (adenosine-forming)